MCGVVPEKAELGQYHAEDSGDDELQPRFAEQEEGAPHPGEGRQQQAALDRVGGVPALHQALGLHPAQQLGVVGEYSSRSTGGRRDGALLTGNG